MPAIDGLCLGKGEGLQGAESATCAAPAAISEARAPTHLRLDSLHLTRLLFAARTEATQVNLLVVDDERAALLIERDAELDMCKALEKQRAVVVGQVVREQVVRAHNVHRERIVDDRGRDAKGPGLDAE